LRQTSILRLFPVKLETNVLYGLLTKVASPPRWISSTNIKTVAKYPFTSARYQYFALRRRQTLIIAMHFLRSLVFSAVLYASAVFSATIPIDGEKDVEITIKIQPMAGGANVGVSERLVFSMIQVNSPLSAHLHVILSVYAFSEFSSLTINHQDYCNYIPCARDQDCPRNSCSTCNTDIFRVGFTFRKSTGINNMLISKNYSATPSDASWERRIYELPARAGS